LCVPRMSRPRTEGPDGILPRMRSVTYCEMRAFENTGAVFPDEIQDEEDAGAVQDRCDSTCNSFAAIESGRGVDVGGKFLGIC
jgi:hypothetical protein